ncbi:MAG: hypothetical protein Q8N69_01825 [bacterium]|nr:hypothetical protein [bacterium]
MEEIKQFNSPREHYKADVCIVWCYDNRFSNALKFILKDYKNYDLVSIAGGAKDLAGESGPAKEFLVKQIETSIKLHGTNKIVIMNHGDCGAYGGIKSFGSDSSKEKEHHKGELGKARAFLKEKFPDISIQVLFVDFEKIYEID